MGRSKGSRNKKRGKDALRNTVVRALEAGENVHKVLAPIASKCKATQKEVISIVRLRFLRRKQGPDEDATQTRNQAGSGNHDQFTEDLENALIQYFPTEYKRRVSIFNGFWQLLNRHMSDEDRPVRLAVAYSLIKFQFSSCAPIPTFFYSLSDPHCLFQYCANNSSTKVQLIRTSIQFLKQSPFTKYPSSLCIWMIWFIFFF